MAIDPAKARAAVFEPFSVEIERGALRFYATAIGETDPVYVDVAAARAAGYRDLPVPPAYFFSLDLQRPAPFGFVDQFDVDLRYILHGEQSFEYHALAFAGDTLDLTTTISDVVSKRGGAMDVMAKRTDIHRDGELIATSIMTVVVQYPELVR